MKVTNAKHIGDIKKIYLGGNVKEAKSRILKLARKGPFNYSEKYQIATLFNQLGMAKRALNILPTELPGSDYRNANLDQVRCQFLLATILSQFGATYKARRILQSITNYLQENKIEKDKLIENFDSNMAWFYIENKLIKEAKDHATKSLNGEKQKSRTWLISKYHLASCHLFECEFKDSKKILDEIDKDYVFDNDFDKHMLMQRKSALEYAKGNYKKAMSLLSKCITFFKDDHWTKVKCENLKGQILYKMGNSKEALKYFRSHKSFLKNINTFPDAKIQNLYYLEKAGEKLSLEEKIATRCTMRNCYYPFLLGKKFIHSNKASFPKFYSREYIETSNDCWEIKNNNIVATNYKKIVSSKKYSSRLPSLIDLQSGFVTNNGNPYVLSDIQAKALYALISGGSIGISIWGLIDFIYRHDFISPEVGESRIKLLVSQLNKLGFSIKRKSNLYYFDFSKVEHIVFPMSHQEIKLEHYLRYKFGKIDANDISSQFDVHLATAYRWIKKWNPSIENIAA